MAQSPVPQVTSDTHQTSPAPSLPLVPNNNAAGTKRKRAPERKFYAVRVGRTPGIYSTWHDCLAQVRGSKGAVFKAFPSLHEAQAFINGTPSNNPKSPAEQKFYGVQNGKTPGVYTDWESTKAQIIGVRRPKHKKFATRAEAEAFVEAGKHQDASSGSSTKLSPEEEIRRLIVRNSAPGLVNGTHGPKDKDGNLYPPGTGPMPPGAEDGFDPNIKLAANGTIVHKTEEEKFKTKTTIKEKDPPGMLRIYTDGSSLANGTAGARAGVGVFFGPQDPKYAFPDSFPVYTIDWHARGAPLPSNKKTQKLTNWRYRNVSEALKGSKQTNQRAELVAIQRALDIAPRHRDVTIYTDSKYAIDCVTNWYRKWQKDNKWLNTKGKPVENKDIVLNVREMIDEREELGKGTYFVWVKGHNGDEGNVMADKLAVEGARLGRGVSREADEEADASSGSGDEGGDVEEDVSEESLGGEPDDDDMNGNAGLPNGLENEDEDIKQAFEEMKQAMGF